MKLGHKKKPICIYHANCADGFTGAWATWKKHPDWQFFGGIHGMPPPDVTGRDVVLVDFSYTRGVIEEMLKKARSIVILDHHKSAADELEPLLADGHIYGTIDMQHSGARIAWDWFHPGEQPPRLLLHIEDRDLWRFDLPGTREIQDAVFAREYDFKVWDALMLRQPIDELVREGKAIRRKYLKDIHEFLGVARRRMVIGGFDVPVLNIPYFWSSEAGHIMAKDEAFAGCYWDEPKWRVFSLRSSANGVDVAEIASQYGGGGHANAAGFRMPVGWEGDQ